MKVRMKVRPVGYVSLEGQPLTAWPPVGEVVDLPDEIAEELIKGGNAEKVSGSPGREWLWPWRRPRTEPIAPVKVRIKVRPAGYVSFDGGPITMWPAVGEVVDLPQGVAEDLIAGGFAEEPVEDAGVRTVRLTVKRAWPKVGSTIDVPETLAAGLITAGLADEQGA